MAVILILRENAPVWQGQVLVPYPNKHKPPQSFCASSVAMVMTNVFFKNNEVNLLRKFAKIVQMFDKTDDSKGQGAV